MISAGRLGPSAFDSVFGEKPVENTYFPNTIEAVSTAWNILAQWITPKPDLQEPSQEVLAASEYLPEFESQLMEYYEDSIRKHFAEHSSFVVLNSTPASPEEDSREITRVAGTLKDAQFHYSYPLSILQFSAFARESFDRTFKSLVREYIPYHVLRVKLLNFFQQNHVVDQLEVAQAVYETFVRCGLIDESEMILAEAAMREVKFSCRELYQGQWEESVLEAFRDYIRYRFVPSLKLLLLKGRENEMKDIQQQDEQEPELLNFTSSSLISITEDVLCELRTEEIFDIIVKFPNSRPALNDLKGCLKKPAQRASIVSTFQKSCQKRLLQGSVNTVDIISAYISTVEAFSVLDPKGVLLEKVSRPIRRYLKDRDDTISVLVGGMLRSEGSELEFLSDILANTNKGDKDMETVDDLLDADWYPDPIDAPPDFMRNSNSDMLDSLISLYENKEVFVKEIVGIFADRMLSNRNSVDEVIANVQLLKLRFGDRELQNLDVMIRDMLESQKIETAVHELETGTADDEQFHATILSRLFWPSFKTHEINLPPAIEEQLKQFSGSYSQVKKNRNLQWLRNLGQVTIQLDFEDRVRSYDVTASQAAAISVFESGQHTIEQFMAALGIMEESFASSLLSFWVHKGVLVKENGQYRALERLEGDQESAGVDEVTVSSVQSAEERANEEMKVYWSYIMGMLTNLGATPIARIHSFLKVLVPAEINYTKSEDELERYLTLKVDEGELDFIGGNYKLKSS
ncbi:anaphase promoting complex subunit 2 [Sugiyamaella lignohabitans]|uniref:Anaphase-promoting complex subunit 2 n=1 Tax=Sugiyamaella lignohabitans TaxID=796027 RepID=A0A167CVI5_9ASCO|nr:anaphase promoting complex subunit 2 [Sugiyamaella lignohabitans]ANB12154.1 anaphase promoting complex subunit 2 [Sugiyamaella lignohabitans]